MRFWNSSPSSAQSIGKKMKHIVIIVLYL
jgi:hypothetical protein